MIAKIVFWIWIVIASLNTSLISGYFKESLPETITSFSSDSGRYIISSEDSQPENIPFTEQYSEQLTLREQSQVIRGLDFFNHLTVLRTAGKSKRVFREKFTINNRNVPLYILIRSYRT
ncbi:MAG: hypothetical protein KKA07_16060 [Bacteroidetes bacterium]|nr:hypothetical protein [Bacteroidota bacterium]MBU1720579.1 hypothetical protein [Bacteroidota bacterium]